MKETHKKACEQCIKDCTKCKLECMNSNTMECVKCCEMSVLACRLCLSVCTLNPSKALHISSMKACHDACMNCYEECRKHTDEHCKKCAESCLKCAKSCKTHKHTMKKR